MTTQPITMPAPCPAGLVETIEASGFAITHAPEGWLGSDPGIQNIINTYPGSAAELRFHQQQKLIALAAEYAVKIAAGFVYTVPGDPSGAHTYQIDPASLFNVDAKALKADLAIRGSYSWPADFYWVTADNSHVPMTAQQMRDFGSAADDYVTGLFFSAQALKKTATVSAKTAKDVDAVDVTAGWPVNA